MVSATAFSVNISQLSMVNGDLTGAVPVSDRGLAFGDGLFETMRLHRGQVPLWPFHQDRLKLGGQRLAIPIDFDVIDREKLDFLAMLAGQGIEDGVIKLIVTRGSSDSGYRADAGLSVNRYFQWRPRPLAESARCSGVRCFPCVTHLSDNPRLAGLKHLNRLEQVLARNEWRDDAYQEGVVCDFRGRPVEGTLSNLFVVNNGELLTPDLSRCGVAGVMRRMVMDQLAPLAGIPVREADLGMDMLLNADELFLTNAVFGIWPVCEFQGRHWQAWPVVRLLQERLEVWFS